MMNLLKAMILLTVFVNYGNTRDIRFRKDSKKGGLPNYQTEESKKLRSAKSLLGDPYIETFKFIHPGTSGFDASAEEDNSKLAAKQVAKLKFYSGAKSKKKAFKVKLTLPKITRNQHKRLKGIVIFPENMSSFRGECKWDFQRSNGRKIIFVPKACIKMVAKFDGKVFHNHKVFGLLIPRKNKQFGLKRRKITKNFVLVSYGKRMEARLRKLAVNRQFTRLIVSMKKHERR